MNVIEIQTIEGGRLSWVAIYSDSERDRAIRWGHDLRSGLGRFAPNLRITDGLYGPVIGAWQDEGYNETNES